MFDLADSWIYVLTLSSIILICINSYLFPKPRVCIFVNSDRYFDNRHFEGIWCIFAIAL